MARHDGDGSGIGRRVEARHGSISSGFDLAGVDRQGMVWQAGLARFGRDAPRHNAARLGRRDLSGHSSIGQGTVRHGRLALVGQVAAGEARLVASR